MKKQAHATITAALADRSMAAVARDIGISHNTIYRISQNPGVGSWPVLCALADYLQVDIKPPSWMHPPYILRLADVGELAGKIKAEIERRSDAELIERTRVCRSTVYHLRKGGNPTPEVAHRMSYYLGLR